MKKTVTACNEKKAARNPGAEKHVVEAWASLFFPTQWEASAASAHDFINHNSLPAQLNQNVWGRNLT